MTHPAPAPAPGSSPIPLTPRQREIYAYLFDSTRRNGYQPSIRDLGRHLDIASPNGVVGQLRAIAAKGWIRLVPGQGRAVRFLWRPDGTRFEGF